MVLRIKFAITIAVLISSGWLNAYWASAGNGELGNKWVEQQGELRDREDAEVQRLAGVSQGGVSLLGEISFVVPRTWRVETKNPSSAVLTLLRDGRDYCSLRVGAAFFKDVRFADLWTKLVVPITNARAAPDWGESEYSSISGYPALYGHSSRPGRSNFIALYRLESSTKAVPVIVEASSSNLFAYYRDVINKFLDRVRAAPDSAHRPKPRLTIADLVGEWTSNVVNTNANIMMGTSYNIFPDGRYSVSSAGFSYGSEQYRDKTGGRVQFINNQIVFDDNGGPSPHQYWFIGYEIAPDESTVLTLLPGQYKPSRSVSLYQEVFIRKSLK